MTVETYAQEHSLSPETVRRYIRLGKLKAHCVGRRYEIDTPHTYDTNHDTIHDNIQQMQSEIDHLREALQKRDTQIEQLNSLLAMQTKQNSELIAQLPPPRPSLTERITKLFAKLSTKQA